MLFFNAAKNVRYEVQDSVGVVTLDMPDSKVNTLNQDLMSEFKEVMSSVKTDDKVKAVVIVSAKPDCFIAGADIG